MRALDTREYFRSTVVRAPAQSTDDRAERILGAKIIQFGDVNDDRPVTIDAETLRQVAELGNQPNKGIKARFAHPSMSDDGLGRYLGRWSNFRVDGDAVLADLQIAESAHEAPEGDLAAYVLELAREDPEAFGVSIVSRPDWEAMDALRAELPEGARVPLRLKKLRAADFVDEPAATRGGLFSVNPDDPRSLAPIVARILDEHFSDADPVDVLDRFARMLSRHYGKGVAVTPEVIEAAREADQNEQTEAELAVESAGETEELSEAARDDLAVVESIDPQDFIEAFGDRGARWYLEGLSLGECYRLRCQELEALCESLEARLNAALDAMGEAEPVSHSVELSETDRRKAARNAAIEADMQKGISEPVARWSRVFARE